jgi:hypothetical protein
MVNVAGHAGFTLPAPARPANPEPIRRVFSLEKHRNFFPQEIAPIYHLNHPERLRDT